VGKVMRTCFSPSIRFFLSLSFFRCTVRPPLLWGSCEDKWAKPGNLQTKRCSFGCSGEERTQRYLHFVCLAFVKAICRRESLIENSGSLLCGMRILATNHPYKSPAKELRHQREGMASEVLILSMCEHI